MGWLPSDCAPPASTGKYMKLGKGKSKFRILTAPIAGNVGWAEIEAGKKRPVRKRLTESFAPGEVLRDANNSVRYFLCFGVFNYATGAVEVLELTQRTLIDRLISYTEDPDYGDPTGYDIEVERTGDGMGTKYLLTAKPPKAATGDVADAWSAVWTDFDLERMFDGGDPFGGDEPKQVSRPRAREDREATLKALFATAKELWPTAKTTGELKDLVRKHLSVEVESFTTVSMDALIEIYDGLKSMQLQNTVEDAQPVPKDDDEIPF